MIVKRKILLLIIPLHGDQVAKPLMGNLVRHINGDVLQVVNLKLLKYSFLKPTVMISGS